MTFFMVNPSKLPIKSRRNPELLIVNPSGPGKKRRKTKMAKRARRNPVETIKKVLLKENLVKALVAGVGGGAAMALGAAVVGNRLGETSAAQAAVGVGGGLLGAAILGLVGKKASGKVAEVARMAAPLVGAGAISLSVWELARPTVVDAVGKARAALGLGAWTKEFSGYRLGQSYYDEFTPGVSPGGSGVAGLGAGPNPILDAKDNPFMESGSLSAYEPLGDVYNTQRLGSFERESGFGSFQPEEANPRDQQIADQAKHQAGFYGGLGAATLFEPVIHD